MSDKITPMQIPKISDIEIIYFLQKVYQDQTVTAEHAEVAAISSLQHNFPFAGIEELYGIHGRCKMLANNKAALHAVWSLMVSYHNAQYKYLQQIYPDVDLRYFTAFSQNSKDAMNNYKGFKAFMDCFYAAVSSINTSLPTHFDNNDIKKYTLTKLLFNLFLAKLKLLWTKIKIKTKVQR